MGVSLKVVMRFLTFRLRATLTTKSVVRKLFDVHGATEVPRHLEKLARSI